MEASIPLVSVWCPTFNHESYIHICLDSILNQKTSFPFEIIVHDDASKDNTQKILLEYKIKYPDKIRLILQQRNMYSVDKTHLLKTMFKEVRGKYFAICEGDDYWTDELKLQKQFDFLEENLNYQFCGHKTKVVDDSGNYLRDFNDVAGRIDLIDAVIRKEPHTSSYFFRNNIHLKVPDDIPAGDVVLICESLLKGPGYVLPDNMSSYRLHGLGLYSPEDENNKILVTIKLQLYIYRVYKVNRRKNAEFILEFVSILRKRGIKASKSLNYLDAMTLICIKVYMYVLSYLEKVYYKLPVMEKSRIYKFFARK